MRVTLTPMSVGDETFGPYDCVQFSITPNAFQAETANGSIWLPTTGRYLCLSCVPIASEEGVPSL